MKNLKNLPLVSIVMPVYNAGGFLVDAIESILKQTYKNFEFIIVNDHSTDNFLKIIKKYQKRYPKKIKIIDLKRTLNRGGDACANEGLAIAKGKYIARMDADDISQPTRLEKQVDFLEKNKDISFVGSNAFVIDKKGKIIGEKNEPETSQEIYKSYFTFHPLIHPSVMYRKKIGKNRFFYPKKFSANNDYYVFFKLICQGYRFYNIQEKLIYYRIHDKNDTFNNIKEKFLNTLKIRFLMVIKYNYPVTFKQVLLSLIQGLMVLVLPSFITKKLYLLAKGIDKKVKKSKISFSLRKNLSFS